MVFYVSVKICLLQRTECRVCDVENKFQQVSRHTANEITVSNPYTRAHAHIQDACHNEFISSAHCCAQWYKMSFKKKSFVTTRKSLHHNQNQSSKLYNLYSVLNCVLGSLLNCQ